METKRLGKVWLPIILALIIVGVIGGVAFAKVKENELAKQEQLRIEKGLEVREQVDERYHLEKSTQAACEYLKRAKEKFGSWTMAAASYNGGMSGLQKQIEFQKSNDYYDLWLTEETARYVFRILALKEIMKNPEKYGYLIPEQALYKNVMVKKITVDSSITDLADFALKQGINYKILKTHNPWLRDKKLENATKKAYEIHIPIEGYQK